jgi:hypothetical protein
VKLNIISPNLHRNGSIQIDGGADLGGTICLL